LACDAHIDYLREVAGGEDIGGGGDAYGGGWGDGCGSGRVDVGGSGRVNGGGSRRVDGGGSGRVDEGGKGRFDGSGIGRCDGGSSGSLDGGGCCSRGCECVVFGDGGGVAPGLAGAVSVGYGGPVDVVDDVSPFESLLLQIAVWIVLDASLTSIDDDVVGLGTYASFFLWKWACACLTGPAATPEMRAVASTKAVQE
jgi:hypothetical protein